MSKVKLLQTSTSEIYLWKSFSDALDLLPLRSNDVFVEAVLNEDILRTLVFLKIALGEWNHLTRVVWGNKPSEIGSIV